MPKLPTRELRAVHDNDLAVFLEKIGLLEQIRESKATCASCGSVITLENFGATYPESGEIRIVCDRLDCLTPALRRR